MDRSVSIALERLSRLSTSLILSLCLFAIVSAVGAQEPNDQKPDIQATPVESVAESKTARVSPPEDTAKATADGLKIEFVKDSPGIILIKSGDKVFRVDSVSRTILDVSEPGADTSVAATAPEPQASVAEEAEYVTQDDPEDEEDEFFYEPGDEPFDYRLVNVPTPKMVPKGSWNLSFSHRFSQPIHPISDSAEALLGFDSFSVSSFGVTYGITDKIYFSASRSPVCRQGLCKTIELGLGYHVTDQNEKSPIGLSFFGSVEGDMNFSKDYTFNLQTMISRKVGKRVHLFFSPAVHINSNSHRRFDPKPEDFFPTAPIANTFNQPKHGASFGFGTAVMVTPSLLGVFEFTPRTGFKLGRVTPLFDQSFNITGFENTSKPTIGFGVQKNVGSHSFSLTFSNTQTTTTSRYNSSNLLFSPRRLVIGFNLFRRL